MVFVKVIVVLEYIDIRHLCAVPLSGHCVHICSLLAKLRSDHGLCSG